MPAENQATQSPTRNSTVRGDALKRGGRVCLDKLRYNRRILGDHARRSAAPSTPSTLGAAWAGAIVVALSTVAWAAWLYRLPADYTCSWGVNAEGVAHFAGVLGVPWRAVTAPSFAVGFRLGAAAAFLAYIGMLARWLVRAAPPARRLAWLAGATLLILAVAGPPALSPDVYAYVGYARLQLIHGLNPYETSQLALVRLGDPTGAFLHWPLSSPYGPLWTLTSLAAVFVFPRTVIWGPLVLLKLVCAAAVLAMGEGGRRLAERLTPGRGSLVYGALVLNPLFLMEGVVNGHNDVVMMAFVVWALAMAVEERHDLSFALLGLGAAVKFVPLLLAPWLLVLAVRAVGPGHRLRVVARAFALAVAPLVLSFAVFWRGARTLGGLRSRSALGQRMAGGDPLWGGLGVLAIYVGLTWWVLRGDRKRLLVGWAVASVAVGTFASGISFPWYVIWPLGAAVIVLEERGLVLCAVLVGYAVAKILQYT
jgi:hypothetical protein